MKTETPESLLRELIAAYDLLNEAYWLALRQLKHGGVEIGDQWSFWSAFQSLDDVSCADLGCSASDHRPDAERRPDAESNPFYMRADALRDLLHPQPVEAEA